jgi:hypothetical protein
MTPLDVFWYIVAILIIAVIIAVCSPIDRP